ncbi:hypothetical protein DERP_011276, partial [Dermatophagoides pteronyssinus]
FDSTSVIFSLQQHVAKLLFSILKNIIRTYVFNMLFALLAFFVVAVIAGRLLQYDDYVHATNGDNHYHHHHHHHHRRRYRRDDNQNDCSSSYNAIVLLLIS